MDEGKNTFLPVGEMMKGGLIPLGKVNILKSRPEEVTLTNNARQTL
jgi:hypothetical protein